MSCQRKCDHPRPFNFTLKLDLRLYRVLVKKRREGERGREGGRRERREGNDDYPTRRVTLSLNAGRGRLKPYRLKKKGGGREGEGVKAYDSLVKAILKIFRLRRPGAAQGYVWGKVWGNTTGVVCIVVCQWGEA